MLLLDIPVGVMVGIIQCGKYRDEFAICLGGTVDLGNSLLLLGSLGAFHLGNKRVLKYL